MKTYKGIRKHEENGGGSKRGRCEVSVDGLALKANENFEWGYRGKRALKLSEAILLDIFCETLVTKKVIHQFKEDVIRRLAFNAWQLSEDQIENWLDHYLREQERMKKTHVGNR